jgi:integrase
MPIDVLSDVKIRAAKCPSDRKQRKLFDGDGLYLLIRPTGAKCWRLKYVFAGVERLLSLGQYPDVSLKRAREKRHEARALLDRGIDPCAHRDAARAAAKQAVVDTFGAVAEEWFAHYQLQFARRKKPLAPATITKTQWLLCLRGYTEPRGGVGAHPLKLLIGRPIQNICKEDVGSAIQSLLKRHAVETAHRMLGRVDRVFRFAIGGGRAQFNPAAAFRDSADPRDALPPVNVQNHPGLTDPRHVGELLRAIAAYKGLPTTEMALKIAPYVFLRPIELRWATWSEFDLDGHEPTWRIPEERMKMRRAHVVPLAPPVIAVFRELRALTGPTGLVFPSAVDPLRPISENSVTSALRRMGYLGDEMTWHGFRTTASTLLNEQGWDAELIELQLAHRERNAVRATYNKAMKLNERRKMMCAWAKYLDGLRNDQQSQTFEAFVDAGGDR